MHFGSNIIERLSLDFLTLIVFSNMISCSGLGLGRGKFGTFLRLLTPLRYLPGVSRLLQTCLFTLSAHSALARFQAFSSIMRSDTFSLPSSTLLFCSSISNSNSLRSNLKHWFILNIQHTSNPKSYKHKSRVKNCRKKLSLCHNLECVYRYNFATQCRRP